MPRYPLVLFDLDGTLVDSFGDICAGIAEACRAVEVEATPSLLRLATRGIPLEDFYEAAFAADPRAQAERARFERFVDAYRAHYLPGCVSTTVPFPGVVDTLRELRASGARVGVATTKRTDTARRVLEGTGLAPLVDAFSGCDDIPHKPHPAVLQKVAGQLGVPVTEAIMVGDTDRDVGAARAAGCPVVAVGWGGFSVDELAALGPDHLIREMRELVAIVAG